MLTPTLVVTPTELDGYEIRLDGERYHHLFRVRRLSAGDEIRLVDGSGRARSASVATVTRGHAVVGVGAAAASNEPSHRVELVVGALKRERASWLVEKSTELGAAAVRFLASERSPRRFGAGTLDRLRRVARGAVEQCGRARVPEVTGVHPWSELPELLSRSGRVWVLDPLASPGLAPAEGPCALLVGPEGGWSAAEREAMTAAGWRAVGLGERVLRVETAAVAALARVLTA